MFQDTITAFMKSVDLQPLQCLAAVRVAISVCEIEDVQNMIRRFRKTNGHVTTIAFSENQWRLLRCEVERKMKQMGVPAAIIEAVLGKLWPIAFQIYRWNFYHKENVDLDCSTSFCWTPQASIDYEKTAEILVKDEELDIKQRFKLACTYCLDIDVRSLYEQMSLSERRLFFVRGNLKKSKLNPIVRYWSYYIQEVPIDSWQCRALNHTRVLIYAVQKGLLSATKFFLGKIRPGRRKKMITNLFYIHFKYNPKSIVNDQTGVACYLVCQLPPDYYEINNFPFLIFYHFLGWPLQKHFMSVIDRLRSYLKDRYFYELLVGIFAKIIGDYKDYDYMKLFMEFWPRCPERLKILTSTEISGYDILMNFVRKHFEFVFDENSFAIKSKFRAVLLQQETPKDGAYFGEKNIEFFKFLVRERVTTKSSIYRFSNPDENLRFHSREFFNLPLGELIYLMDGILGSA